MKLIFVPGLGFTSKLFSKLKLDGHEVHLIEWIEPIENEKLHDYAIRLFSNLHFDPQETALVGHSFGGILCQEIADALRIKKVFLISSIVSEEEKPFKIKMLSPLKISSLVTKNLILSSFPFWAATHGYHTEEEKELYVSMISEQSTTYLRWAMTEISKWKPLENPKYSIYRIHGSKDQTFPIDRITTKVTIVKDANHFMVYKRPKEVANFIKSILD